MPLRLLLHAVLWSTIASGGAVAAASTSAEPVHLCIDYAVKVPAPARAAFQQELRVLLQNQPFEIRRKSCAGHADVLLTVRQSRPLIPEDALGLAVRDGDQIRGALEIFLGPLLRATRAGCWETVGRAMARVASHELLHYLEQEIGHDEHGLFAPRLSRELLVEADARPLLIARLSAVGRF